MQLFFILGHFLLFYPPNSPKNQNFMKMKKTPRDIINLYRCTKNHDHMLYCSWDMVRDRCTYFSFWATFCPFTHPTAQKIKILQKLKKHLDISSFYIYVPKTMIRWCKVPEIWCATDRQKKWHTEVGDPPKKRGLKVYPSKKWKPYNWEVLALKES